MPFMKGIAPIRRTTKYLSNCGLVFKERVKIMTVNFNDQDNHPAHQGARDFVFWNIPQVQYKNPDVQIVTLKNMTPSPFITCFLEDNSKVYFDVDSQSNKEIVRRLTNTLGKTKDTLDAEAQAAAEKNKEEVERHLKSLPFVVETPSQIKAKTNLEKRLQEIEDAQRLFSRRMVFVKI